MEEVKRFYNGVKEIANQLKILGEKHRDWERIQLRWQKNKPPFNDFCYYVALATTWQAFSKQIEGEYRRNFTYELYIKFKEVVKGKEDFSALESILKKYKTSRFMAGKNLLELYSKIVKEVIVRDPEFSDPLLIQGIASSISSRTQHWIAYAPLEASIVIGELYPAYPEIIPPLGKRVMAGFELMGLNFDYPPTKRDLEIVHGFLLHLAKLSNSNHLLIEIGMWLLAELHK